MWAKEIGVLSPDTLESAGSVRNIRDECSSPNLVSIRKDIVLYALPSHFTGGVVEIVSTPQ